MTKAELIKAMEGLQDDARIYVLVMDKDAEWCSIEIKEADVVEDGEDKNGLHHDAILLYPNEEEL